MKNLIMSVIIGLFALSAQAQKSTPSNISIKLYNEPQLNYDRSLKLHPITHKHHFDFNQSRLWIAPALAIQKNVGKRQLWEFEISRLNFETSTFHASKYIQSDPAVTVSGIGNKRCQEVSIRFEYNYLLSPTDKKSRLYAGVGINPFWYSAQYSYTSSEFFPVNHQHFGSNLYFTVKYQYDFNPNWYLDMNLSVNVLQFNRANIIEHNPNLRPIERQRSGNNFSLFPMNEGSPIFLRIGIGYRF